MTVKIPEIGTEATAEGEKETHPFEQVTITDTVSYTNLIPGQEYTITGVLMDKDDPSSLISKLNIRTAKRLIAEGVIAGGMIPKVECCIEALKAGVKKVFVIDGRVPHSLLMELLTDEGLGTMFTKN